MKEIEEYLNKEKKLRKFFLKHCEDISFSTFYLDIINFWVLLCVIDFIMIIKFSRRKLIYDFIDASIIIYPLNTTQLKIH